MAQGQKAAKKSSSDNFFWAAANLSIPGTKPVVKSFAPRIQSPTDLFWSDLPILSLRRKLLTKAARQVAQKLRFPFSVPILY